MERFEDFGTIFSIEKWPPAVWSGKTAAASAKIEKKREKGKKPQQGGP